MRILMVFLTLCIMSAIGNTATIWVPDDYLSIQAAIGGADNGDVIIVRPDTYHENIDFIGKAITVRSEQGAAVTIIDGDQLGTVVSFQSGEGSGSVLDGFTVTNGLGTLDYRGYVGGGILCYYSSPILSGNIITKNQADAGGGIGCEEDSDPQIINNKIIDNTAIHGGGIYCYYDSTPQITGNAIVDNSADDGAGIFGSFTNLFIKGNLIEGNSATNDGGGIHGTSLSGGTIYSNIISSNSANNGGGIYFYDCAMYWYPDVGNNMIIRNSATSDGGGVYFNFFEFECPPVWNDTIAYNTAATRGGGVYCEEVDELTIKNAILWKNDAPLGKEVYFYSSWSDSKIHIDYSDLEGGSDSLFVEPSSALDWGLNNIDKDPKFVDPPANDFHITWCSFCRDSGDNSVVKDPCDFEGDPRIDPVTVDIGADEYHHHLYCRGEITPGETVKVCVVGWPNGCTKLLMGSGVIDPPLSTQWGDFHLEAPVHLIYLGLIPLNGVLIEDVTVPLSWAQGETYPFQAFIGSPLWSSSRFTNLMTLTVD